MVDKEDHIEEKRQDPYSTSVQEREMVSIFKLSSGRHSIADKSGYIDLTKVWEEAKNWKQLFKFPKFFEVLILGLSFPLFDCWADFNFAYQVGIECNTTDIPNNETQKREYFSMRVKNTCSGIHPVYVQSLTYFFVSLSGLLLASTALHRFLIMRVCQAKIGSILSLLFLIASLSGTFFLLVGIPIRYNSFPWPGFLLAILNATVMIGVKILACLSHGPETQRLSIRITNMESNHESALQLMMMTWITLYHGIMSTSGTLSMVSSLLMIGKAGAENCLTFGKENKLKVPSLSKKIYLLILHAPVFFLTAIFRIGTLAIMPVWGGGAWGEGGSKDISTTTNRYGPTTGLTQMFVLLTLALSIPLSTFLIMRFLGKLMDIDSGSIIQGAFAELATISLWGERGREDCQKIIVSYATFLLLLYSSALIWVITQPTVWMDKSGPAQKYLPENMLEDQSVRIQVFAIICICSGWLSYFLLVFELYKDLVSQLNIFKKSAAESSD